jgi:uncharacterized membrane protein
MSIFNFHNYLLMVINIQKFISSTYNIPINMLKGKSSIRNSEHYKIYNLSILLCWLLHPTQVYGCKSTIARLHKCNMNRVHRLNFLYLNNSKFKSFVDNAIKHYKSNYASD